MRELVVCQRLLVLFFTSTAKAHQILPVGVHPLDWHSHQVNNVISGFGGEGYTSHIDDKHCMTGRNLYFDVLDDYAFYIDETVELEIEFYLKNSAPQVELSYDANAPKNVTDGSFAIHGYTKKLKLPPYSDNNRWHKETFSLNRARFAGLGSFIKNNFHIGAMGAGNTTICSIAFKRSYTTPEPESYGHLFLKILDEKGQQVPARVGLYDQTGRMPLPSEDATPVKEWEDIRRIVNLMPVSGGAWPANNRRVFYSDGDYHTKLPAGTYDLVVSRGMEYRFIQRSIKIETGKENRVEIALKRWAKMPAQGWGEQ